jgi:hypothetical protein
MLNIKKGKFPCQCHEGVRGSNGIGPLIPNCSTRWRKVVTFIPRLLYPQEETMVSTEYEARLAPELVKMFWRRESPLVPSGFELRAVQHIA